MNKPKANEPPPWKPKAGAETRWFTEWTMQQWDNLWSNLYDAESEARHEAYMSDPANAKEVNRLLGHPELPMLMALGMKDEKKFVRLMRDPEQAAYAFRLLTKPKRKVGRPRKQEPEQHLLDWPLEIVRDVEYIWKRHYGKWQRGKSNPPTVYDIAAKILKREGVDIEPDAIQEYRND